MKEENNEQLSIREIGIIGGNLKCHLGTVFDALTFFDCIPDKDWGLITDRLYRRYLRQEDIEPASKLMDEIKEIFSTIANNRVKWHRRYLRQEDIEPATTLIGKIRTVFSTIVNNSMNYVEEEIQGLGRQIYLDINLPTLDLIFSSYFESFNEIVELVTYDFNEYGEVDTPIRLTVYSGVFSAIEERRPIKQYEDLSPTDDPFWLLPEDDMFNFSAED